MTSLLDKAYVLASELHADQLRKGTRIPYLSHLFAVCSLVLEDGGGETPAAAALLHDAAEDQGGHETIARIRAECKDAVAELVVECSDSLGVRDETKAPWHERKTQAIRALATHSRDALLIIAADKLHNARSTLTDLQSIGPEVWKRFQTGRDGFIWYHQQMLDGLTKLIPESRSVAQLATTMRDLSQLGPDGQPTGS